MTTHRSYLRPLGPAIEADLIDGLAHITGGGLVDNLPRILPDGCGADIDSASWPRPPLFRYLVRVAGLNRVEAHQILNMGIGMVAVVSPDHLDAVQGSIPEATWVIGKVVAGDGVTIR